MKNLHLYLTLSFFLLLSISNLEAQTGDTTPILPAGSGSEVEPYLIADLSNLLWLSENIQHWDKYYLQTADIDASTTNTWNSGEGWIPIGTSVDPFTGNYNGDGYAIDGLYINTPGISNIGFFSRTSIAVISNLGLTNLYIIGNMYVGGIVGRNVNSHISNSHTSGSISGQSEVGGLVGYNNDNSIVTESYSLCNVSADYYLGGLVGHNRYSIISNSYSACVVDGGSWTGGITGRNNNSTIENCYSISLVVDVDYYPNALVGEDNSGTVINSYWNTQTTDQQNSGQDYSIYGEGKITAELVTQSTFVGWDFGTIWSIIEEETYPYLQWQTAPANHNYPDESLLSDILAHYHLNGNGNDASIYENHGTSDAFIPIENRFDEAQTALYFDSSNPISVPSNDQLSLAASNFTISMWFTLDDIVRQNNGLLGRNEEEGIAIEYNRDQDQKLLILMNADGTTGWDIEWKPEFTGWEAEQWYFVMITRAANVLSIYINGELAGTNPIDFGISNPLESPFYIGRSYLAVNGHLGKMDDLRIYNRALSESEMLDLYYENDWKLPEVSTALVDDISYTTATSGGVVTDDGGTAVTARGAVWGTTENPTLNDNVGFTVDGEGVGEFVSEITGLNAGSLYFVRAYATNSESTAYGQNEMFITLEPAIPVEPEGTGTEIDPYLIADLNNLLWLSENSVHWDKHFLQIENVNAAETKYWNEGKGWSPVGNINTGFTGSYDGQYYTIDGLYINRPDESNLGFFGLTDHSSISNLGVASVEITGHIALGGLVGNHGYSLIVNCYSSGSILSENGENVGGLVGSTHYSEFRNSHSSGSVNGHRVVGGLIGAFHHNGLIINSYSTANVTGHENIGGLAGFNNNSVIENSYSTGYVSSPAEGSVGGLVESSFDGGTVVNSFWDEETSGRPYTGQDITLYGMGLSSIEMKTRTTFTNAGWQFVGFSVDEIWNIGNGRNNGYPYHSWQYPIDSVDNPVLVTTNDVEVISDQEVTATGTIEFIGDPVATQHGFCWNTTGSPTINDSFTQEGPVSQVGEFTSQIIGISPNTMYYVRAYATNDNGTSYGNELLFLPHNAPVGSGTIIDPFLVPSLGELYWIAQNPNHWDKHYRQTADIDASGTKTWYNGKGWKPIGQFYNHWDSEFFEGSYNGAGFIIDGLYINRPQTDGLGLFGAARSESNEDYLLSGIHLHNVEIIGKSSKGGLVGFTMGGYKETKITHCSVSGIIRGSGYDIGGLAGFISETTIEYCNIDITIVDGNSIGGLVGVSLHNSQITGCSINASASGIDAVGGIVGRTTEGDLVVSNSYTNGSVNGNEGVGGLIGDFTGNSPTITNITNSYSLTAVNGNMSFGGLVGKTQDNVSAENSYYNTETSGISYCPLGEGRNTDEMTHPYATNTFVDWDFQEIWAADEDYNTNNGYPFLRSKYLPAVLTKTVTNVTQSEALAGGVVISEDIENVSARGVVWSTFEVPTLEENEGSINEGPGPSEYNCELSGLTPNTVYYIRAYATNEYGSSYGKVVSFKTYHSGGTITDIDGNKYPTVTIGNQVWMAKNLMTTKYNNGDPVPYAENIDWENTNEGAYDIHPTESVYGLDDAGYMLQAYGALYNFYAVQDPRGLCPDEYRVPTDEDWSELVDYVGGINGENIGNQLKSCRQVDSQLGGHCATNEHPRWNFNDIHYGTDDYGFSALPGGYVVAEGEQQVGIRGLWWTSTVSSSSNSLFLEMRYDSGQISESIVNNTFGLSVRCLKDAEQYTVAFIVTDGVNPIENAEITIEGVDGVLITDPDGAASVDLTDGIYTYGVTASEFEPVADAEFVVDGETITVDVILEELIYNITYDLDGGENHEGNPDTFTQNDLPIYLHDASKTDYNFEGWFDNEDFSGEVVTKINETGDVTLYANFTNTTMVNSHQAPKIKLFPNPNSGSFIIESSQPIEKISIHNISGIIVYLDTPKAHVAEVNFRDNKSGVYFVKIKTQTVTVIKKVVINENLSD